MDIKSKVEDFFRSSKYVSERAVLDILEIEGHSEKDISDAKKLIVEMIHIKSEIKDGGDIKKTFADTIGELKDANSVVKIIESENILSVQDLVKYMNDKNLEKNGSDKKSENNISSDVFLAKPMSFKDMYNIFTEKKDRQDEKIGKNTLVGYIASSNIAINDAINNKFSKISDLIKKTTFGKVLNSFDDKCEDKFGDGYKVMKSALKSCAKGIVIGSAFLGTVAATSVVAPGAVLPVLAAGVGYSYLSGTKAVARETDERLMDDKNGSHKNSGSKDQFLEKYLGSSR